MTWKNDLKQYLIAHESDIASDFEDFDKLDGVFYHFLGRWAQKAVKE